MIIQFIKKSDGVYAGSFNGNSIEIQQIEDSRWVIVMNGSKTQNVPFTTKDRAIRHVERQAEKILEEKRSTAVARQGKFSSVLVSRKEHSHSSVI